MPWIAHQPYRLFACLNHLIRLLAEYLTRHYRGLFRRHRNHRCLSRSDHPVATQAVEPPPIAAGTSTRFQPKPPWVLGEVIRLKALMPPDSGCRVVAAQFNRLHGGKRDGVTVGRNWVAEHLKKHRYQVLRLRRALKHRRPRPMPAHLVWAMDMTGLPDENRQSSTVLGIVDHGSRWLLALRRIHSKASIALLRALLEAIEQHGAKPRYVRTDNEAVFTSRLFRLGLWWLGIKHQRTDKGCPWTKTQERFLNICAARRWPEGGATGRSRIRMEGLNDSSGYSRGRPGGWYSVQRRCPSNWYASGSGTTIFAPTVIWSGAHPGKHLIGCRYSKAGRVKPSRSGLRHGAGGWRVTGSIPGRVERTGTNSSSRHRAASGGKCALRKSFGQRITGWRGNRRKLIAVILRLSIGVGQIAQILSR